ncbi:sodium/pantothenate symporter [Ellagibacter isourolithinifaciens]|uniref:sodium/pantothenate symporter n=1 Tax=Ellagibacter isourolithinifaciens TaxID=2137581 RepID=UPI003AEF84B9
MSNLVALVPLVIFLVLALAVSLVVRHRAHVAGGGFVKEYFIGNRALGGFVLAMTTIATYGSVSSFVGGPGQAWLVGWGWVYMAVVQVTALVLLYGILGKKMALVSRKLDAVTVIDVIRARYSSNALANVSAVVVVLFFAATMVAQFVGGAKLFEAVTGYSYLVGLVLFGVAVVLFTTIGGFRGVAVTDAICGVAMLIGIFVLAAGILAAGGGYENIMDTIRTNRPEMLEPFGGGSMPASLYFTQWLLVGIFTFVLPQSAVRCMGFKNTKALHGAMIMGTVIIGLMMIGVTSLGVLSAGVLTGDLASYGGSVDNIIPQAIAQTLPPWLAGVAIIGPIAASISTVSSLLIASSSAIIKDVYLHHCESSGKKPTERKIARSSQVVTLCVGAIVFVLAIVPPDVIWKINMFAFGGLETAFFWVLVCGLFWKRAGKWGALLSMIGGTASYCLCMALGFKVMGLHQIVIGITVAGVLMVVGSLLGRCDAAEEKRMCEVFFPE